MFYIVLLAMVAAFLALRLYSVLGKRTGHEQTLVPSSDDRVTAVLPGKVMKVVTEPREPEASAIEDNAAKGLRAIVAAEPGFDLSQFLEGAQAAYRMILEAYWKGDEAALKDLTEDDVREAFAKAIAARGEAGHVLENRLVAIEKTMIVDAQVEGKVARIAVRLDADIAAVTRDAEGNVVAGSTSDAVQTRDIWTFAKTLKSGDSNWKLAETDEA